MKRVGDGIGGSFDGFGGQMGVAGGRLNLGVAEQLADHWKPVAGRNGGGSQRVSKVGLGFQ